MEQLKEKTGWFCKKDVYKDEKVKATLVKRNARWVLPLKYHRYLTVEVFVAWNVSTVCTYLWSALIMHWKDMLIFAKSAGKHLGKAIDNFIDLVISSAT